MLRVYYTEHIFCFQSRLSTLKTDLTGKVDRLSGTFTDTEENEYTGVTVDGLSYDVENDKLLMKVNGADTVIPFSGGGGSGSEKCLGLASSTYVFGEQLPESIIIFEVMWQHGSCTPMVNFILPSSEMSGRCYSIAWNTSYSTYDPSSFTYSIDKNENGDYQITTQRPSLIFDGGFSQKISLGTYLANDVIDVSQYKGLIVKYYYNNEGIMQPSHLPYGLSKGFHLGTGTAAYTYLVYRHGSVYSAVCAGTSFTLSDKTFTTAYGAQDIIAIK